MFKAIFLFASIALSGLEIAAAPVWPNEPAGSQPYMDCPFSNSLCGLTSQAAVTNIKGPGKFADTTFSGQQPASPSGALDQHLPIGETAGGANVWVSWSSVRPVREVYMATWWASSANSEWSRNNGNKLLFIRGADLAPENNYLIWQGQPYGRKYIKWAPQSESNNCHITGYTHVVNECGSPGKPSSGFFEPNGPHDGFVEAGSGWHLIEIYKRASTAYDSRDGILRIWIDGILSTNYTNINESFRGFTDFQYNHTWSGAGPCDPYDPAKYPGVNPLWYRDCTTERHQWFDHLKISFPNCLAGGCPLAPYLIINSATLPSARVGTAYSAPLIAEGGSGSYTWTLTSGSLQDGLSLNANSGVISGTPTCGGKRDFTVRVSDNTRATLIAQKSFSIVASGSPVCASAIQTSGEWLGVSGEKGEGKLRIETTAGHVRFTLPEAGAYSLSVYDLAGKKVRKFEIRNPKSEINLKDGVYMARVTVNGQQIAQRFMVVR